MKTLRIRAILKSKGYKKFDETWYTKEIACERCNGTGRAKVDEKATNCMDCLGDGRLYQVESLESLKKK